MSIKKTASLILLVLLCTALLPDVQGWWAARRRRRRSSPAHPPHRHAWQKGRTISRTYSGWHTQFEHQFRWECSENQESIWNIQSAHEYYHEDRVWGFYCKNDYEISSKCNYKSPGNVNSMDGTFSYICPRNGHVAGMFGSAFNGYFKDREFNFYCCEGNVPRSNCKWTPYQNSMDGGLNYKVPYDYYLAGVQSYHNDRYEDRRWKFYVCQSNSNWDTKFLESFSLVCSSYFESISNIKSTHENGRNDRVWGHQCRHNPHISTTCAWNGDYLNDYNGNIDFTCPKNGYIEGMKANTFDSGTKDRRFNFRCCDGTVPHYNCKWTSYVNSWDGDMNYQVPSGYHLAGAYSYHLNQYQDRRWKFYICQ